MLPSTVAFSWQLDWSDWSLSFLHCYCEGSEFKFVAARSHLLMSPLDQCEQSLYSTAVSPGVQLNLLQFRYTSITHSGLKVRCGSVTEVLPLHRCRCMTERAGRSSNILVVMWSVSFTFRVIQLSIPFCLRGYLGLCQLDHVVCLLGAQNWFK